MFNDSRSKKVVLVAHCLLNQNARIDTCAFFPGAMGDIARALVDSGVGVLQMPCPELECLGLDRSGRIRDGADIGIREALLGDKATACRELARGVARQCAEYRKHGFAVIGAVGNDGSPACGVDFTWYLGSGFQPGTGAFIIMLRDELAAAGIEIPFTAVQDHKWDTGLERVRALLAKRTPSP
jgi:predicted secreted protein